MATEQDTALDKDDMYDENSRDTYSVWQWPHAVPEQGAVDGEDTLSGVQTSWEYPSLHTLQSTVSSTSEGVRLETAPSMKRLGFKKGYESGYEKGMAEGRKEGHDVGYKEGLSRAEEELSAHKKRLEETQSELAEVLNQLEKPVESIDAALTSKLTYLVIEMAGAIAKKSLQLNEKEVLRVLEAAVSSLPLGVSNVTLTVRSDALDAVQPFLDQRKDIVWQLRGNDQFERGDVFLSAENTTIDATLKTRLTQFLEQHLSEDVFSSEEATAANNDPLPQPKNSEMPDASSESTSS